MSEIATIIAAIAGLVTALAAFVAAMSKLGPVITAYNKMLADHHKREMAAKSKAASQSPASKSEKTSVLPLRRRPRRPLRSMLLMIVSLAILFSLPFVGKGTDLVLIVVCCTLATLTIVMTLAVEYGAMIINAIVIVYERLQELDKNGLEATSQQKEDGSTQS
jgi:hypothetical protein